MKTLADRLIAKHDKRDDVAVWAAGLLKRPERNHGDQFQPAMERFILPSLKQLTSLWDEWSPDTRISAVAGVRFPLPTFWVEVEDIGFLVNNGVCTLFSEYQGRVAYRDMFRPDDLESGSLELGFKADGYAGPSLGAVIFAIICYVLTQPRMATVERIVPKGDGSARAQAFRRAMRGAPVYSFNRVTITLPRESRIGGEVQESGAGPRKRLHWVSGHWRLIDWTKAAPYWTWVPGHKKGCEDLGEIVKERHIRLAPGSMGSRRGFWLPTHAGAEGERVAAVPVMSRAA